MEFDWTTFALEIINFAVLLWILQRFLYKPVTNAIAERKTRIDKTLADANALRAVAQSLEQQYENRVADWEREKAQARMRMLEEIDAERGRLMAALNVTLEGEREKARALEDRHALELRQKLKDQAFAEGAQFVARLLTRVASPTLQEKIQEMLLDDLPRLAAKNLQSLRDASQKPETKIKITSAYPLGDGQRRHLVEALSGLAGQPVACDFGCDPDLTAGFRISIGPWTLGSNLRDELKFFAEAHRAD